MHYLCLVFRQESDTRERDTQAEPSDLVEALVERGYDITAYPLAPSSAATTLRRTGDGLVLTDGPVTTGSARLEAIYVLQARDLNDAVRLATWLPEASSAEIEIRPLAQALPRPQEPPAGEETAETAPELTDESVSVAG